MSVLNLAEHITQARYYAQQGFLHFNLRNIQEITRLFLPPDRRLKPDRKETLILEKRYMKLLADDIANVKNGFYPKELLFQFPFTEYLPLVPELTLELGKMLLKVWTNSFKDLPGDVNTENFPDYFQRNFHWQSDGYFSYKSAKLYDVGVESLFLGTADIMRRQIIPHITDYINQSENEDLKLLDVAAGTGRFLQQINLAHPDLRLHALDLSPYYLQFARQQMAKIPDVSFINANAEEIPFADETFDIITCVYLFHELPRSVRKKVLKEMFRVLKKGGLFIIQDSVQLTDSGNLAKTIYRFAYEFHEPYYKDYIHNDLAEIVRESNFQIQAEEIHFVAKSVVAVKPVL